MFKFIVSFQHIYSTEGLDLKGLLWWLKGKVFAVLSVKKLKKSEEM